ncbi:MAG: hypothetical protein ACR2OE_16675 [Thermomicrobiales bacterium]
MPTFKNTSDHVFQDGDLIVKPGDSFSTEEQSRVDQMRGQYAWQFDESKGDKAPTEAEVKDAGVDVRPSVGDAYVEVDDEGKQSRKIG